MYTLQELSDRMEILEVIARYSAAVDGQQWGLLDDVFTPDCDCDFLYIAGFRGDRAASGSGCRAAFRPAGATSTSWVPPASSSRVRAPAP